MSSPRPAAGRGPGFRRPWAAALALIVGLAGCGPAAGPAPTAADFGGIVASLGRRGVDVARVVSGDAGCADPALIPTAISFAATGPGVAEPRTLRVYIFRNRDAYDRLNGSVDACARSFIGDPADYERLDAAPFVLVGEGPWPAAFRTAVREALAEAAGAAGAALLAEGRRAEVGGRHPGMHGHVL